MVVLSCITCCPDLANVVPSKMQGRHRGRLSPLLAAFNLVSIGQWRRYLTHSCLICACCFFSVYRRGGDRRCRRGCCLSGAPDCRRDSLRRAMAELAFHQMHLDREEEEAPGPWGSSTIKLKSTTYQLNRPTYLALLHSMFPPHTAATPLRRSSKSRSRCSQQQSKDRRYSVSLLRACF